MKTLISWQAYNNDYLKTTQESIVRFLDPSGPTFGVHSHFWEESGYSRHIILNNNYSDRDIKNFNNFLVELRKAFPHREIVGKQLMISDVINVSEITAKLTAFLAELSEDEIEIFVSPGTPAMQTAWYLLGTNFRNNVRLFQTRAAKFVGGNVPERVYIDLSSSSIPTNVTVAQSVAERGMRIGGKQILITDSLKPVYSKAAMVSNTDNVGCLILGENGTGKENLANYIHEHSNRREKPFLAVNCAAFSDELLRSELFGHEVGAFTGANTKKKGLFVEAKGGTIFLDEIGDISPRMQVSLLRVLQEKMVQPVGSTKEIPIDVRVIAATNKNLEDLCEKDIFRWDLFFRLAVTTLTLPALRERGEREIEEMIQYFNKQMATRFPSKKLLKIATGAKQVIKSHGFKGNIRELENLFLHLYTFCEDKVTIADLPERILKKERNPMSLKEVERQHIIKVYGKGELSLVEISVILGCTRDTLRSKLREYGIMKS